MFRRSRFVAFAVLALLPATPVLAQVPPQACLRLEAQLAALDQQPRSQDSGAAQQAYAQRRADLDRVIARSRGMGCGRTFLFGPRPPAECRDLDAQINRSQQQLDQLEAQISRGQGDAGVREARRRDLITALAANQCGAQYQAALPPPPPQQRSGGLFGLLFGGARNERAPQEAYPGQPQMEVPQTSTFRTVCVRTCDGFFFPVSYATVPGRFAQDEAMCRKTCPGTEAELFSYPNPGGSIQQATSATGVPYAQLPNAFKYQKEFVKDCSCKPANMSWTEALSGADDDTLQRGDIVVDEERAKRMSQPDAGRTSPADAARAAQDSANSVTSDGIVEGGTDAPPPPEGALAPPPSQAQAAPPPGYYEGPPPPVYEAPRAPQPPVYAPPQRTQQPTLRERNENR